MSRVYGFTGTQRGMTEIQQIRLSDLLELHLVKYFHHGDCIGADDQGANIAHELRCRILAHPPIKETKRAFNPHAFKTFEPKHYLERNKEIVRATQRLIATPGEYREQVRSGTWSTVWFARKMNGWVTIIYPDGRIEDSEGE